MSCWLSLILLWGRRVPAITRCWNYAGKLSATLCTQVDAYVHVGTFDVLRSGEVELVWWYRQL